MTNVPPPYVPFSVRNGNAFTRLRWWPRGVRERLALRLAPWLDLSLEEKLVRLAEDPLVVDDLLRDPRGGKVVYGP